MMGRAEVGDKVIVAGGGVTGCEAAGYLAQKGRNVTIIEAVKTLIPGDEHLADRMTLLEMINDHGIVSMSCTKIKKAKTANREYATICHRLQT